MMDPLLCLLIAICILRLFAIWLDAFERWLARRRNRLKVTSRITIGSNPEPFTIVDKSDSTIRVDRHDPNLKTATLSRRTKAAGDSNTYARRSEEATQAQGKSLVAWTACTSHPEARRSAGINSNSSSATARCGTSDVRCVTTCTRSVRTA